jgi:hypothetical protein
MQALSMINQIKLYKLYPIIYPFKQAIRFLNLSNTISLYKTINNKLKQTSSFIICITERLIIGVKQGFE